MSEDTRRSVLTLDDIGWATARIAELEDKYSDLVEMYDGLSYKYLDSAEKYNAIAMDKIELRGCVADLEGKLAKAVEGLKSCMGELDDYSLNEYPSDHPVHVRYRKRDYDANPARATLEALIAEYPKGAG